MLYNIKTGTIGSGDDGMNYYSFGSGKKKLIMIQGLSTRGIKGTALSVAHMYRSFTRDFTVYLIDRRNVVREGFTVWDIADDVIRAMDELGIEKASVYGVSQGGMAAQAIALKMPERIEKLVLAVTLSRPNETIRRVVDRWTKAAEKGDYVSINRDTFLLSYSEDYLRKYRFMIPIASRLIKPDDMKRFSILAKACTTFDIYDRAEQLCCPVFVIGARKDKIVTGEASEELARKIGCKLYMYENYGHGVYTEAPDINKRVLDFLTET